MKNRKDIQIDGTLKCLWALKNEKFYFDAYGKQMLDDLIKNKDANLRFEDFTIRFIKWLTRKDSPYSIMYGGTPKLKKDYRFATGKKDYTIEEVLKQFKKTLK